jgi:DNA-binding response OmpR family regulator
VLTATRPLLSPLPARTGRVVVLEDVRGAADGLVTMLADGGFKPVVGGISWKSLLSVSLAGSAATILVGHSVNSTIAAVCAELRRREPAVPLICVLGSFQPADVVRLIECGADDVLPRQTDRSELRARIAAHIRRAAATQKAEPAAGAESRRKPEPEAFGAVVVDSMAREVRVGGRPVRLGRLEFELVEYLSGNAGVAISWDQIAAQLYGPDPDVSVERLEILVRRVRAKLAAEGNPTNLVAVPGWGYRWDRRHTDRAATKAS